MARCKHCGYSQEDIDAPDENFDDDPELAACGDSPNGQHEMIDEYVGRHRRPESVDA